MSTIWKIHQILVNCQINTDLHYLKRIRRGYSQREVLSLEMNVLFGVSSTISPKFMTYYMNPLKNMGIQSS